MDDSRGQIILVAALAIAVTFVALALVVNTVIFTENLATRETVSGKEAVAFQQSVGDSGTALLERANAHNNSSYDSAVGAWKRDIGVLSEAENDHAVVRGSLRSIEVVSVHNGTKIKQSTVQHVNDTEDDRTWVAATGITATRGFTMTISTITADQFAVNVTDGSAWWRMNVQGAGPTVEMSNESGTIGSCTASGTPFTIGVTNGSVDGSTCSSLIFAEGVSTPYDISIEGGDNVTATYELIVDKEEGALTGDLPEANYANAGDPTLYPAIFNGTLTLQYTRSDLSYSSNVTVEPAG